MSYEQFGERRFVARKPRKRKWRPCSLCWWPILPGDLVQSWCMRDGRDFGHAEVHGSCEDLRPISMDEWEPGELRDAVGEAEVLKGLADMRGLKEVEAS